MATRIARGNVRSVKIFDSNRRGEIIFRTGLKPIVEITLKLSIDNDSAFCGMAAVTLLKIL